MCVDKTDSELAVCHRGGGNGSDRALKRIDRAAEIPVGEFRLAICNLGSWIVWAHHQRTRGQNETAPPWLGSGTCDSVGFCGFRKTKATFLFDPVRRRIAPPPTPTRAVNLEPSRPRPDLPSLRRAPRPPGARALRPLLRDSIRPAPLGRRAKVPAPPDTARRIPRGLPDPR